jgi:hypothetical protein
LVVCELARSAYFAKVLKEDVMIRRRLFSILAALSCGSLIALVACKLDDGTPDTISSFISIYNASPDAPGLDVSIDDRKMTTKALEYGDHTAYFQLLSGEHELKLIHNGTDVAFDSIIKLSDYTTYSLFLVDAYANLSTVAFINNEANPGTGKCKLRLINLSPDAGTVQIRERMDTINYVGSTAFKHASAFVEIPAGIHNLEVILDKDSGTKLEISDTDLGPGLFYSILVRGYRVPPSGVTRTLGAEVF